MSESDSSQWWKRPILGLLIGWVVGMLWWAGLMIAIGPSPERSNGREWERAMAWSLVAAPVAAIPWGIVGLFVGAITLAAQGLCVPTAAGLGAIAGGVYSLATSPIDGWLALTMPLYCLGGASAATVAGAVVGGGWQMLSAKKENGRAVAPSRPD